MDYNIEQMVNRHMGRCLEKVEELDATTPKEVKRAIKNHLMFLAEDICNELSGNRERSKEKYSFEKNFTFTP